MDWHAIANSVGVALGAAFLVYKEFKKPSTPTVSLTMQHTPAQLSPGSPPTREEFQRLQLEVDEVARGVAEAVRNGERALTILEERRLKR